MKRLLFVLALSVLAGCTTTQITQNPGAAYNATSPHEVAVMYHPPRRDYESLGVVSAKKYQPGWTDPSVADAIPQLRAAAAQMGADAIIVMQSSTTQSRNVTVEAEAIRYVDRALPARAAGNTSAPAQDCASCGQVGRDF